MTEPVIHRNESDYPWELDPDDAQRAARIRVRTFVSGGRTPTSGLRMGVFEMPPGAVLDRLGLPRRLLRRDRVLPRRGGPRDA